jgi:hypothetical protein
MQLTPSACSVYAESNFRYTQVKTQDTPPDCIQVTDSDGREVVTVFLADLLRN